MNSLGPPAPELKIVPRGSDRWCVILETSQGQVTRDYLTRGGLIEELENFVGLHILYQPNVPAETS